MVHAACHRARNHQSRLQSFFRRYLSQSLCRRLTLQRLLFVQHALDWDLKSWRYLQQTAYAHCSSTYSKDAKISQVSDTVNVKAGPQPC